MINKYIFLIIVSCFMILEAYTFNDLGKINPSSLSENKKIIQNYQSEILEGIIDTKEYILGPGDEIYVSIVTSSQVVNLNIPISPIGNILIPVVGVIKVNGLNIDDAFRKIQNRCLDTYNDSSISITLSKIRKFKIKVLGSFKQSGEYISTPVSRVSDIYNQIIVENYISDSTVINISNRNIELYRDRKNYNVDLVKYYINAEDSLNPIIKSGDVLKFNIKDQFITVSGAVKSPGEYEYKEGESLSDIINLSGGFRFDAYKDNIEISRYLSDLNKVNLDINEVDFSNTTIYAQDFINIKTINNFKEHKIVEILGEVVNPGNYSISEGKTAIKEIIDRAGGYTDLADKSKILLTSQKGKYLDDKIIINNNYSDITNQVYYDYVDKAYNINIKSNVRTKYAYYSNQIIDYKLFDKDIIEIPKNYPYIELVGAVKYPGIYSYNKDYSIKEYLKQAGGITNAETNDIYIIKSDTGQRINYNNIKNIEKGDVIYIIEKIEITNRTKKLDRLAITQGVISILSFLLSISIVQSGS